MPHTDLRHAGDARTRVAVSPAERVVASSHDGGMVLVNFATVKLFATNRVGARIWRELSRQVPVATIADSLAREFSVPRDVAIDDVTRFVDALSEHQLVVGGTR